MTFHDHTAKIEEEVRKEQKPGLGHLLRLFLFAFKCTKEISTIYLGAFLVLSFLRPFLAFLWGRYIQTAENSSAENGILAALLLLAGYFVIQFLIELLNRYVYLYDELEQLNVVQANRQQEKLYAKLYRKLALLRPEYFEVPVLNDRVDQVFRFTTDKYGGLNTSVMLQGYVVISKAVSVITIAMSLYFFQPWLCLLVLAAPLPTVWTRTVGQKLKFEFMKDNTVLFRRAEYFQDVMLSSAGKELKTFGLYDFFFQKWKTAADEYTVKEKELIHAQSKFLIFNALIISLTTVSGMVAAILLMAARKISLGALGAVLALVTTLVGDMKELLTGFATFQMKKQEAAQFFDLMEMPEQGPSKENESRFEEAGLRGVKYRYPLTDKYVLDGVDLKIRKGEKVAFVGENGAGKSTAVKLLTGLLQTSEGEVLFSKEQGSGARCGGSSVVCQNPARYLTFTAADNVYLGDTMHQREDERIQEALDFAGLGEIDGGTFLGKEIGGTELSGGQWQKLAIARSVYRNRELVILDEPTSNLDPLAEAEIFRKYLEMAEGKTVIFVTHRMGVAALADRVVVFSGGRIVQEGTHQQLIHQKGEYARLYWEQAKWYDR